VRKYRTDFTHAYYYYGIVHKLLQSFFTAKGAKVRKVKAITIRGMLEYSSDLPFLYFDFDFLCEPLRPLRFKPLP